jgi:hypothetical protein
MEQCSQNSCQSNRPKQGNQQDTQC